MQAKVSTSFIFLTVTPASSGTAIAESRFGYLIGVIIALIIMGYLIYTLIRPEKF